MLYKFLKCETPLGPLLQPLQNVTFINICLADFCSLIFNQLEMDKRSKISALALYEKAVEEMVT